MSTWNYNECRLHNLGIQIYSSAPQCSLVALGYCPASEDGYCVGGTEDGHCLG